MKYVGILKVTPMRRLRYIIKKALGLISELVVVMSFGLIYCNLEIWFASIQNRILFKEREALRRKDYR